MRDALRSRRRSLASFAVFVATIAAFTGLTVSPAVASTQSDAISCDLTAPGSEIFTGLDNLTPAVSGRGTAREPVLDEIHEDLPASAKGKAGGSFRATVPVYFHVVTDGTIGSLTAAQIADQIAVLNVTFGGGEGGARTGFTFELAGVTRTDNPKWFYASIGGAEHDMKRALHRGGDNALNLYSTTAGPYLGWAYLPKIADSSSQAYLDGVVVDWESMRGTSTTYAGRFDQGETATHEVGHWLNLEHAFYNGCGTRGDFVADTPPEKTPTSGCPAGKDTCTAPGLDPIHNYMDYSFDTCYTEFTKGQTQRMRDAWLFYRA